MRNWLSTSTAIVGILGLPAAALADFMPPAGVMDYRLAFVTDMTTDATSTDIATYNTIVSTEAADNPDLPSTIWTAIASTASVSAASNISCGATCDNNVPIFLVDGTEVATSATALFEGAIMNSISEDEFGDVGPNAYVWTGSNSDGSADAGATLGTADPEAGNAFLGTIGGLLATQTESADNQLSLLAISGEISAPVPEPISLSLLAFGGIATGLAKRRKRQPAT
jgi:hypothetical protein